MNFLKKIVMVVLCSAITISNIMPANQRQRPHAFDEKDGGDEIIQIYSDEHAALYPIMQHVFSPEHLNSLCAEILSNPAMRRVKVASSAGSTKQIVHELNKAFAQCTLDVDARDFSIHLKKQPKWVWLALHDLLSCVKASLMISIIVSQKTLKALLFCGKKALLSPLMLKRLILPGLSLSDINIALMKICFFFIAILQVAVHFPHLIIAPIYFVLPGICIIALKMRDVGMKALPILGNVGFKSLKLSAVASMKALSCGCTMTYKSLKLTKKAARCLYEHKQLIFNNAVTIVLMSKWNLLEAFAPQGSELIVGPAAYQIIINKILPFIWPLLFKAPPLTAFGAGIRDVAAFVERRPFDAPLARLRDAVNRREVDPIDEIVELFQAPFEVVVQE